MTGNVHTILKKIRNSPHNVHFADLTKICEYYFGTPRDKASSHHVYKTPWASDPRVNIQNDKGKAKIYQVRQVIAAIDKLTGEKQ